MRSKADGVVAKLQKDLLHDSAFPRRAGGVRDA